MYKLIVRRLIWMVMLLLFLLANRNMAKAEKSHNEKTGDIVAILIPATAFGTIFYLNDTEGRNQFYKSFFTNGGVTYGLKKLAGKKRPDGSDNESFPSLHTSMAFQGAAFMQKRYNWKYALSLYMGAIFVGYSRVDADKHYTEDVIAGAVIGFIAGYCFTTHYKGISITPAVGNEEYGLLISKKW